MKKIFIIISILTTLITGCDKEELYWIITTGPVSDITESTSTVSGDITSVGSTEISSYGHCWSKFPLPTINDSLTNLGFINSTGTFSSSIKNLSPNTTYHVRAYVNNSFGTSYGNQASFKTKATLCKYYSCESLSGFTTYVDKISPSSSAAWTIGSGYSENGFSLIPSCYGGYIEFSIDLPDTTKMTFWTKSINPGYSNRTPEVTIDNIMSTTTMIDGSASYTKWMQLETQNILPGNHIIRINFTHVSTFYSYYIDEIEIWCQ